MRFSGGNHSPQIFSAHFLRKSPATKLFQLISLGNRSPQTFSAHFLRKSAATKLFQLISSGNRSPQNFFSSFPQEIGRHKLFQLISSGNRPSQNFFGSFPQEIGSSLTHSFPQAIVSDRIAHAELALTMKGGLERSKEQKTERVGRNAFDGG